MRKLEGQDFKLISVIMGILATVMILLPVLFLKDSETSYTGIEVAFGKEFASLGTWASGEIAFNLIVLLAFILPLTGSIVLMTAKEGYLLSTIMFIIAAVLIFMIPQFTTVTVTILDDVNEIDVEWTYGIGLVLAASFSILGALLGVATLGKIHR